jgi:hypothetical protein
MLLKSEERKARKEHKCALCRGKIEKGKIYIYESYREYGKITNITMHKHCVFLMTNLDMNLSEDIEYFDEEILNYIYEMSFEDQVLMLYNFLEKREDL